MSSCLGSFAVLLGAIVLARFQLRRFDRPSNSANPDAGHEPPTDARVTPATETDTVTVKRCATVNHGTGTGNCWRNESTPKVAASQYGPSRSRKPW